jgi:hypothetical protein
MPEEVVCKILMIKVRRILLGQGKDTNQDDDTEATGREKQVNPGLDLAGLDVEARGDDTSFVQATVELDNDLARTVVINQLEFANVACED